jgi:hypothetical protein
LEILLWWSSDGDLLRSDAHGLNDRSASVLAAHHQLTHHSEFPNNLVGSLQKPQRKTLAVSCQGFLLRLSVAG